MNEIRRRNCVHCASSCEVVKEIYSMRLKWMERETEEACRWAIKKKNTSILFIGTNKIKFLKRVGIDVSNTKTI